MKALQGYEFFHFNNIILGIHEYYISNYNASGRSLFEERKINIETEKEEAYKAAKLAGD